MLIKLKAILVFASLLVAVPAYSAEWNYKKPSYDPTGATQLKILDGALKDVSNTGQGGIQSSASPTVLSVNVGSDSSKELYDISAAPPLGRYRAILSEDMIVGGFYEITTYYYRTGGSGTDRAGYQCVPIESGKRIIQYTGPGQTFASKSVCSSMNYGLGFQTSIFTIVDSKTIDGSTSNWDSTFGYDNHNVASVSVSPLGKKEIYSLWQTPAQGRYRANLYEPLEVGRRYEITGHFHRTGGSGTNSAYRCLPVRNGVRIIKYEGPGQSFTLQSTCLSGVDGYYNRVEKSTFIIKDDQTIDGLTSNAFDETFGYDNHNVVSVVVLPPPRKSRPAARFDVGLGGVQVC